MGQNEGNDILGKCVSPVSLSPPLSEIALYKKTTRSGARGLSLAVICAKTFFHLHHPLSYRQCPIRPYGAPSPRGEGWRYGNTVSQNGGVAATNLLSPLGKGDRGAVDRVLSLAVICTKTFFHLHHLSRHSAPPTSALWAPPSKGRRDRYTRNGPHSRPFLWKGLSGAARRGWLPCMFEIRFPRITPPLSGIAPPYIFAAKPPPQP